MLKTSKLKDNQQSNDVIQVCFILEGYHQRGPTHPTEDTDRPYPEDQHIQQRKIQTDPTQRASIREDQHIQQRKIQTDPTQRSSIR